MKGALSTYAKLGLCILLAMASAYGQAPKPGQATTGREKKPESGIFSRLVCPPSQSNPRNSEGDVIPLKDGRLLLAYTEF